MTSAYDATNELVVAPFASDLQLPDLQSEVWQQCQPVTIKHFWSGAVAPRDRHAQASVCWTSGALIARFDCRQAEPLVISSTPVTDKKTLGLWDRDVCEIFLAPNPARPECYFEFEASPTGEWVDLGIEITPSGRKTDWEYASGMTTTASLEPDRLVVGIRIPWSDSIPKPNKGELWRINLFRCVSLDPEDRYLAWRPTGTPEPNFHVPAAFGWLRFD